MKLRFCDMVFLSVWSALTLLLGILCLPALLSRTLSQNVAKNWAGMTLMLLKSISGISSHVRGYSYISATPVLYAVKHQSAWETFMLWHVLDRPVFVLKRALYRIPIFGWYLWRSGQIAIKRGDGKQAIASAITQAQTYIGKGRSVVIFPEGTRTRVGENVQYKSGVTYISEALGVPVVPVAINAGKFWPKSLFIKRSGNAVIEFLPAMPPAGMAKEAWLKDLKERIETASTALLAQE
jgi:1-acyl-sn-glycerol-3-phosphate acyltransferase